MVHFDNELPGEVELADFGYEVNEDVVGGGGKRRQWEGLGIVENSESNLGRVFEAEEGLVEEVRGQSDAVELQRGLHGMEWVMVVKENLRNRVCVCRGLEVGEVERREGADLEGKNASLDHPQSH